MMSASIKIKSSELAKSRMMYRVCSFNDDGSTSDVFGWYGIPEVLPFVKTANHRARCANAGIKYYFITQSGDQPGLIWSGEFVA